MRDAKIWNLLESMFTPQKVARGALLFHQGSSCPAVPILKEGLLKVYLLSETGRELTLYSVMPGQMCIIAMLTAYSGGEYPAYTRAEEDTWLYMVPSQMAVKWFNEKEQWRSIFMDVLSENLLSIMSTVCSMLSDKLEKRLAMYLLSHAKEEGSMEKTHEEIARDVGSVRVVVSRVLKEFEREGILEIRRGKILVKDHQALRRRAGDTHP